MPSPANLRPAAPRKRHRQTGAALITALVFLIVLTIIGISAMQTTTMQQRMAGTANDRALAFQAAEIMLREAEARVATTVPANYTTSCTNGLCASGSAPNWKTYQWNDSKKVDYGDLLLHSGAASITAYTSKNPQYFVEYIGLTGTLAGCTAGNTQLYRIVARGYGMQSDGTSPITHVVLESYFAKC